MIFLAYGLFGCRTIPDILFDFFLHVIPITSQFALWAETRIFEPLSSKNFLSRLIYYPCLTSKVLVITFISQFSELMF